MNAQAHVIAAVSFGLRDTVGLNFGIASESIDAFLAAPAAPPAVMPQAMPAPTDTPAPRDNRRVSAADAYALFPSVAEIGPGFVNKGVGCNPTTARFSGDAVVRCEQQLLNGGPDTIRNIDVELHSGNDQAATEFQRLADEYFKRPIQTVRTDVACVQGLHVCSKDNVIVWVYMKDSYDQRILDLVLTKIEQHLA